MPSKYSETAKKRRQRLKEQGLCIYCGREQAREKSALCVGCAQKQIASTVKRRVKLQQAGMCVTCGKEQAKSTSSYCISCALSHTKSRKIRVNTLREEAYAGYGGFKCVCCGVQEPCFLTLDHVDGGGRKHRAAEKLRTEDELYKWVIKNNHPPLLQVMCFNCNCGRARNGGVCPHHTTQSIAAFDREAKVGNLSSEVGNTDSAYQDRHKRPDPVL